MPRRYRPVHLLMVIAAVILGGCNLPQGPTAAPTEAPEAIYTYTAQTVEARLTQAALLNTATVPVPTAAAASTDTPGAPTIAAGTATSAPATAVPPSATALPCDKIEFVDETIDDGTDFAPGASFTKTWKLKNSGTCSWTTSYAVVFIDGTAMGAPAATALTGIVNPGQTVEISIPMTAPTAAGSYRANFKLRNAAGVLFGIGDTSGPFWVQIDVVASTGMNLVDLASQALWVSCGDPCGGGTVLTFGGPDDDSNGFAMLRNGYRLENGSSPDKVLEMHPKWVENGVITGLYPVYKVQKDDRFKARLGFLPKADGTCGVGNVVFQLNYQLSGTLYPLGSWNDTCDGNLISIDINLQDLTGKSVQFALAVLANGPASQDWAVWVNPRVEP